MAMKKPTFKIHKREGPYKSFQSIYIDIKFGGKKCGNILESREKSTFEFWLSVKKEVTKEFPCPFQNIKFKHEIPSFPTKTAIAAAKQWVIDNWEVLTKDRDLYFFED